MLEDWQNIYYWKWTILEGSEKYFSKLQGKRESENILVRLEGWITRTKGNKSYGYSCPEFNSDVFGRMGNYIYKPIHLSKSEKIRFRRWLQDALANAKLIETASLDDSSR
jgi:hypothetical protein